MQYAKMLILFGLCAGMQAMQVQAPMPLSQAEKARKLTESLRQAHQALKNVKSNVNQRFVRMHKKTPQELDIVRSWLKDVKLDDKTRTAVEFAVKNGVDRLFETINKEFDLELEQFEPQLEQWFSLDTNSPGSLLNNVASLLQEFIASVMPIAASTTYGTHMMPAPVPNLQSARTAPGPINTSIQQMSVPGSTPNPQSIVSRIRK